VLPASRRPGPSAPGRVSANWRRFRPKIATLPAIMSNIAHSGAICAPTVIETAGSSPRRVVPSRLGLISVSEYFGVGPFM
jgi:hypothetical protein